MELSELIGVPYCPGGQSLRGSDCIGLLWLYHFEYRARPQRGWNQLHHMESGQEVCEWNLSQIIDLFERHGFGLSDSDNPPMKHQALLFRFLERARPKYHVGTYIGEGDQVLITIAGSRSRLVRLGSPFWKQKLIAKLTPEF